MKRMKSWWNVLFSRSQGHLSGSRRIRERVRWPATIAIERLEDRCLLTQAIITFDAINFLAFGNPDGTGGLDTVPSKGDYYVVIQANTTNGFQTVLDTSNRQLEGSFAGDFQSGIFNYSFVLVNHFHIIFDCYW